MQRGLRSPSIQELMDKYQVNLPGKVEVIWQPLYDFQTAAATAPTEQLFFQVPQGQSGKDLTDTNMVLAGQIPAGQRFAITGVEVVFFPGDTISQSDAANTFADDVYSFYKDGALELIIGSKPYIQQGPLMTFPPTSYLDGFSSFGTTVAATTQTNLYSVAKGREFAIRDLVLQSTQNFSVNIKGRSNITSAGRVGVKLNGWLFRNAQ